MSGTTLYVVDMQPGFSGSKKIVAEVVREINLARRRNDVIAFVELNPECNGHTLTVLVKTAKRGDYDKVLTTEKYTADGSTEFMELMEAGWFNAPRVRVCGVNRGACVFHTVGGFIRKYGAMKVELACAATANTWQRYKKWDPNGADERDFARFAAQGKIKLLLPSSNG